jgi:hypothetical protein
MTQLSVAGLYHLSFSTNQACQNGEPDEEEVGGVAGVCSALMITCTAAF